MSTQAACKASPQPSGNGGRGTPLLLVSDCLLGIPPETSNEEVYNLLVVW